MENIISIGGRIDKQTADNLKDYIVEVFKAGSEHNMDQSTIVEAIHAVSKIGTAEHTTITHSNFIGEKHVHVNDGDEEE